jgi:hypothetical protein
MPAPAAPTNLTATQPNAGDPTITLAWSHGGTDLDRFEVLRKLSGETTWTSYLLAPKADFGAGPYSIKVPAPVGSSWAVRALNAAGEVST